jgi:hypothetical protein
MKDLVLQEWHIKQSTVSELLLSIYEGVSKSSQTHH